MGKKDKEVETADTNLLAFNFEFNVVNAFGKVVKCEVIEGAGKTEGEAIAAARTKIDKTIAEDQRVEFTGKFKKL